MIPDYDPISRWHIRSTHTGDGGLNNFFLGTGLKITKNLSLGINLELLFGELKRSYMVNFDDFSNVYHTNATERLEMHGINFNYGLHYTAALKNNYFFNAGVSVTSREKL